MFHETRFDVQYFNAGLNMIDLSMLTDKLNLSVFMC